MKKLVLLLAPMILLVSNFRPFSGSGQQSPGRTEKFYPASPGMVYIPMGSFTMGPSDQDIAYAHTSTNRTITMPAFWMDETEVTNEKYRQFVHYVRDSVAMQRLAQTFPEKFRKDDDRYWDSMEDPPLNWRWHRGIRDQRFIDWKDPNPDYIDELDFLFLPDRERFFRRRQIDPNELEYRFWTTDLRRAARPEERDTPRSEFIVEHVVPVYPDTLVWARDFTHSDLDHLANHYFSHPSFNDYPVVGVSWVQARAFTVWRTEYLNSYLARRGNATFGMDFSLPSEAEWEYAARGGLHGNPYPWGGPYLRCAEGAWHANFKSNRGDYAATGGFATVSVGSFPANNFGLYDMAGNVAEWTRSAYDESTWYLAPDISPDYQYEAREDDPPSLKRKVVRGGSWKDVGYFLQVSTRSYEYQDSATSYIGFRNVRRDLGGGNP